jgi:hypothetical protein
MLFSVAFRYRNHDYLPLIDRGRSSEMGFLTLPAVRERSFGNEKPSTQKGKEEA